MPSFSEASLKHLRQCHPDLQRVAHEAIRTFDFKVICGHRGKAEQDKAYATGKSKLKYPGSKHNKKPALAFDAVPMPLDWEDIPAFHRMAKAMKAAASKLGVEIKWGGDWTWFDGPHFEL